MERVPALSARVRPRVRLPLVAIVFIAFLWTALYTLRLKQYFIQPDELEYVRQAIQIGGSLHPVLSSDRVFTSWSELQPILMSPAWSLLSANAAFKAQHLLNAAIMASTAVPAYLLALRVTQRRWAAYVAAALTVTVPWLAIAGTMMTEVSAYPAFLWGLLGIQQAVTRPSARNDVIGLVAVGFALTARPQFLVLVPTLLVACILQTLRYPPARDWRVKGGRLRAAATVHPVLLPVAVLGLVAVLALGLLSSRHGLLGTYSTTTSGSLLPTGALAFGREALSYVAIGTGVLPLCLSIGWVLATVVRPASAERHAFALIGTLAGLGLVLAVGSFSVRYAGGVNSRYVFYLVPVLFIGTLALFTERRRLIAPVVIGGAIGAWLVHVAKLDLRGPSLVSPEAAFHDVLFGRVAQLESDLQLRDFPPPRVLAAGALVLIIAYALARWKRHDALAITVILVAIAGWSVGETAYAVKRITATQSGVSQDFIDGRSWIDEALPDGATAPMLVSSFGSPAAAIPTWWDAAFWNKKVDRTLQYAGTDNYQQPFPVEFAFDDTGTAYGYNLASSEGFGTDTPYLLRAVNDRRFGFRGLQVLAERNGIQLVTVPRPARIAWQYQGPDDTGLLPSGSSATLRLFTEGAAAERQRVRLTVDAAPSAEVPATLHVSGDGVDEHVRARVGHPNTLELDVPVAGDGSTILQLTSTGTGKPGSQAPVGVQIESIEAAAA
jgi:hypothetical protein